MGKEHPCAQATVIWTLQSKVTELDKNFTVYQNKIEYMQKDISDVKSDVKEIKNILSWIFDRLDVKYVSRPEFENTRDDVRKVQRNINWIVKMIIGIVLTAVLSLVVYKNV